MTEVYPSNNPAVASSTTTTATSASDGRIVVDDDDDISRYTDMGVAKGWGGSVCEQLGVHAREASFRLLLAACRLVREQEARLYSFVGVFFLLTWSRDRLVVTWKGSHKRSPVAPKSDEDMKKRNTILHARLSRTPHTRRVIVVARTLYHSSFFFANRTTAQKTRDDVRSRCA